MSISRKFVVLLSIAGLTLSSSPLCNPAHAREPSRSRLQSQSDDLVDSMRQKAEGGMAEAQMVLAKWRYDGSVLPEDHTEAARWYEMAAKQGNIEAMMALGRMLNEGDGVPRDVRKGCEWYVAAARKGNAEAYFELGRIFENGDGVKADKEKAIKLYEEADKRGETNAASRLAGLQVVSPPAEEEGLVFDWNPHEQASTAEVPDDDWGFDAETAAAGAAAGQTRPARQMTVEEEKARQYDLELQRRAEQEWNDFARQNGGAEFVGELGSGQMAPAPQDGSGWDSGQSEEAILAYANGIGELVGVAAGFESQIDPMIEAIKRHQRVAQYSSDPNERMYSARQAGVWLGTLNGVMEQYKVALNQLFALYIRDGMIFRDAMRMMGSMPECHPIIRAYCRKFISGSERPAFPQSQPRGNSAPPSFDSEVQQTLRQGWLEAIQAGR